MKQKHDTSYYAEFDEESGFWCVFGDNSGHAYSSHADEASAIAAASERGR